MAISIIDPDNGAGTDYLSLAAWVTGEAGDQSGAVCRADYRPTSGSADTTTADLTGFTNFSGWVTIQPQSDTYRHDGTKTGNSLAAKIVASNNSRIMDIEQAGVRVDGMVVENTDNATSSTVIRDSRSDGGDTEIINNIVIGGSYQLYVNDTHACCVVNNIIYGQVSSGNYGIWPRNNGANDVCIYNNTLIGNGSDGTGIYDGQESSAANLRIYNNIVQDYSTDYSITGLTDASGGNISSDTSSPQSGLRSISLTFADAASDDYHLDSVDTDAIGAGTDLDGDSYYAVTVDIDGDSRDASTPDIGADEYVSAGGGVTIFPAVLNSSHNLDPATLAQESALVPAALGQAHVLDSPALIQAYILSPAELGQSHTISQADLSVAGALSPAELAHSQILDIPSLDQASILTPIDLSHANILDTAGLSEGSFVAPVALFTEHNIDQAIVTAGLFPLRPDGLINANSLDDLQLMQAHILFVDDLLNVQTIDAAALLSGVYYAYGGRIVKLSASGRYLTIDASGRYLKIH